MSDATKSGLAVVGWELNCFFRRCGGSRAAKSRGAILTAVFLTSCVLGFFVHAALIVVGAGVIARCSPRRRAMDNVIELVARFLLIGALAFGGGGAALHAGGALYGCRHRLAHATAVCLRREIRLRHAGPDSDSGGIRRLSCRGTYGCTGRYVRRVCHPGAACGRLGGCGARLNRYARFRAFGSFAGVAAIGLLAVTLAALARPVVELHPGLLGGALVVFAAERAGSSPLLLLAVAVTLGAGSVLVI